MTIKEAAESLDINYSTAKHIIKNYKDSGSVQTISMKRRYHEFAILEKLEKEKMEDDSLKNTTTSITS
jgi:transposase